MMTNNFLSRFTQSCKKCGSDRKEVKIEELPEKMRQDFKSASTGGETFFYCKKCDEYSINFSASFFGFDED